MNKNLEHCSLSKVKQFDSGLILGEKRKSSEKHAEKMSEKEQKVVEKIQNNLRFIIFGWMTVCRKMIWLEKFGEPARKSFITLEKWMEKEKFVKSFGIMRDQKRRMRNYGEPSGNICSDLLIEPQVTSLGHDLKWPHDEHTHILPTVPGLTTTKTGPKTPKQSIMDHLRLDNIKSFYHRRPTFTVLELLPPHTTAVVYYRGLPVPYGPYELNFRMRKWLIYHCHPRKSALTIFLITRP